MQRQLNMPAWPRTHKEIVQSSEGGASTFRGRPRLSVSLLRHALGDGPLTEVLLAACLPTPA